MFARLNKPTATGRIMNGSGTNRSGNHSNPSVAISGQGTEISDPEKI
jgi:hypothetical protein